MERICKHCGKCFDTSSKPKGWMANHSRWCESNPKRKEYIDRVKSMGNVELMNAARKKSGITNQYTKARIEGTEVPESPVKGRQGTFLGKKHTKAAKEKIRKAALASDHRRLKKGVIVYKGITLDSSWELALAQRLDELAIKWERPAPLKWYDAKGDSHNYFPDFYLPDYDLYLDPKNPHAFRVQKKKVDIISKTYPNIVWIRSLEECQQYMPR